ncbi:hypothetical protein [Microvirga massiliensis]|uniref:hypothetical protein n=1 Tax=Microvirga massiliensis TaxID=1033741 RepID=UPI00062B7707|nr:hypothetical protein [Microvirga massiliensis]
MGTRSKSGEVVPFGKYKDQPVEVMISDQEYCTWLLAQPWFAERWRDLYQSVVNAGGKTDDTPEHNRLQARFLDEEFCRALALCVEPKWADPRAVCLSLATTEVEDLQESARRQGEEAELGDPEFQGAEITISHLVFESAGWDVTFNATLDGKVLIDGRENFRTHGLHGARDLDAVMRCSERLWLHVECKPVVGDDYPSVLRQIKNYACDRHTTRIALLERFEAAGATLEQLRKIYASSGIQVVMVSEVEEAAALLAAEERQHG